jgi:hypothetical protein
MTPLKLALVLWAWDSIASLVAEAGWPNWRWSSRAVDRLEAMAEALRSREAERV